jgi:hypothetical protein
MSSLEFVNDRIRSYETMLLTAIDTKCSKKQIKYYEEMLNVFKHIKKELEVIEIIRLCVPQSTILDFIPSCAYENVKEVLEVNNYD